MSVSFLKKLKMCKFELTLSHVQLRRTQSRSYTGCRSEKDFANPCETSVFRSRVLRPYAPLHRTRSESVFAGLYSPSEQITKHKKAVLRSPTTPWRITKQLLLFSYSFPFYTIISCTQYPQDADDAEVHQPSSGSAPPESAGAHSQGTHRSHSHQPH